MKFYASVRLDTRRKEILPDNLGIRCKVKVVKNKISAPFKSVMLDLLFGSGIDRMGCTLDAAADLAIVERKGSWYAYKGNNLAQGRQNVVELLKSNPDLADQLETEVRLAMANFGKASTLEEEKEPELEEIENEVMDATAMLGEETSYLE